MNLRPVNLRTVTANTLLGNPVYQKYMDYLGIKFRMREIKCIAALIERLDEKIDLSEFFIGFNIPQINKEFDLLRFSGQYILNIELKDGPKSNGDIARQLEKNAYYLKGFKGEKTPILFTYRVDTNELFELRGGNLIRGDWDRLMELLRENPDIIPSIEKLCDPTQYLVSPFNTTSKFLLDEFFLTQRQQEIKTQIIKVDTGLFSIRGNAGTGKTLLVYDIAKNMMKEGKRVVICHCGYLNDGQSRLIRSGWNIIELKYIDKLIKNHIDEYDVIIIDEVQRISRRLLSQWFEIFLKYSGKIILSGDPKQYLHTSEDGNDSFECIESNVNEQDRFVLKDKIRSNKQVSAFIQRLFNLKANIGNSKITDKNIYVEYFDTKEDAIHYAKHLLVNNWSVISPTSSLFDKEFYTDFDNMSGVLNAHHVIGQEFDNVVTFIGPNFKYRDGKLIGNQTYYSSPKMLFENVTRTRNKLCLIVINNKDILEKILEILSA